MVNLDNSLICICYIVYKKQIKRRFSIDFFKLVFKELLNFYILIVSKDQLEKNGFFVSFYDIM